MRYLVNTTFNTLPTPEMLALIPAEMARGQELDAQGVREALYLAADMSGAWQVLRAAKASDLDTLLASFPLHPYVRATITPLADPQ
jgi:muconolactone delta-isomerase